MEGEVTQAVQLTGQFLAWRTNTGTAQLGSGAGTGAWDKLHNTYARPRYGQCQHQHQRAAPPGCNLQRRCPARLALDPGMPPSGLQLLHDCPGGVSGGGQPVVDAITEGSIRWHGPWPHHAVSSAFES